jgi:cell wall assembly regulator SMI1
MFRSPVISQLLLWHSENRSDRQGGDNLVRHPCNSKAWWHFEENVDPSFRDDVRNVYFALAADGVNPFKQT